MKYVNKRIKDRPCRAPLQTKHSMNNDEGYIPNSRSGEHLRICENSSMSGICFNTVACNEMQYMKKVGRTALPYLFMSHYVLMQLLLTKYNVWKKLGGQHYPTFSHPTTPLIMITREQSELIDATVLINQHLTNTNKHFSCIFNFKLTQTGLQT